MSNSRIDRLAVPGGRFATARRVVSDKRFAFVLVGGVNFLIFSVTFLALYALLGAGLGYAPVVVLAYAFSICCAFVLHRRLVFKVDGAWFADLGRFTTVQLASLALNLVLLTGLVEGAGLPVVPAQFLSMVAVLAFNYTGHNLFSFRRTATRR